MTPEAIESVLADFRSLLHHAAATARTAEPSPPEPEPVDLHTLLGQLIALRQEVNLQTRASRSQLEQNAALAQQLGQAREQNATSLQQLSQTVDMLKQRAAAPPDDDVLRPLLKTLVDLADILALARRETERVCDGLAPLLDELESSEPDVDEPELPAPPPAEPGGVPFWRRWLGPATAATENAVREQAAPTRESELSAAQAARGREVAERVSESLDSVLTGYRMSAQRVERTLQQHGLTPIPCVGEPFDPERMEVVEAVPANGQPSGTVIDEARRGYLWRGRVFRYAQVRVVR